MRKFSLLFILMAIIGGLFAQKKNVIVGVPQVHTLQGFSDLGVAAPYNSDYNTPKLTGVIALGTAANAYGAYVNGYTQLDYNSTLNSVLFVHRQEAFSGAIGFDLSTNGGATFTNNTYMTAASSTPARRYPSAVIYDVDGTTANAVVTGVGPITSGTWATTWSATAAFVGGVKSDLENDVFPGSAEMGQKLYRAQDNSLWYMVGDSHSANDGTNDLGWYENLKLMKGTYNTGTQAIDWSLSHTFVPDLKTITTAGANVKLCSEWDVAFGPDGQTGYFVAIAVETDNTDATPQGRPVIWKTINGGTDWTKITGNDASFMDWAAVDTIANQLVGDASDIIRPFFVEIDLAVDSYNRLHMFANIGSGSDQSHYFYNPFAELTEPAGTYIPTRCYFDIVTQDGTNFNSVFVSTQNNDDGTKTFGDIEYRLMPQISSTENGSHIFFAWNETVGLVPSPEAINMEPDVLARGIRISDGAISDIKNLTAGTDAELAAYMMHISPWSISGGEDFDIEIPMAYSTFRGLDVNPVDFMYLKGVGFDETDFITDVLKVSALKRTDLTLYPNPSNGNFAIFNMNDANVTVYNLVGQEVYSVKSTSDNFAMNLSSLSEGTYIVKAILGGQTAVKQISIVR